MPRLPASAVRAGLIAAEEITENDGKFDPFDDVVRELNDLYEGDWDDERYGDDALAGAPDDDRPRTRGPR